MLEEAVQRVRRDSGVSFAPMLTLRGGGELSPFDGLTLDDEGEASSQVHASAEETHLASCRRI